MRVLFDQGTPAPLRSHLLAHTVETAYERQWSAFKNGELIAAAETAGFDVFVTTDRNLKYQQNLANRRLAIVLLPTTSWPRIQSNVVAVVSAVNGASTGDYIEIRFA